MKRVRPGTASVEAKAAGRIARPGFLLLGGLARAHDRITIHFARVDEGDLAGLRGGQDVRFGGELVWRHSRIEESRFACGELAVIWLHE